MSSAAARAPLEDVMVAMDVVDTLRHRQDLVERELNAEERRARLVERLRRIYREQGIEVTDEQLQQGVLALEEERFRYAPATGFQSRLARVYVSRGRWGKPLLAVAALVVTVWLVNYWMFDRPASRAADALPGELVTAFDQIEAIAQSDDARARALELLTAARTAIEGDDLDRALAHKASLDDLLNRLQADYEIRVVSRPGERSGVWRIPDVNPDARNYYLIVEAISQSGEVVPVRIMSEEDGSTRTVEAWGLRVPERVYESVAADKRDDGIIQRSSVGRKRFGYLDPEYEITTTGDTITDW